MKQSAKEGLKKLRENGDTPELVDNRKKNADEELLVECDFSQVSRRWGKEWGSIDGELKQWMSVIFAEEKDDLSPEQSDQLERGRLDAMVEVNRLTERRNELMAMVVLDVPREWLVLDAPEKIDWSNPDNLLDYVKEQHNHDLMRGVTMARARAAKN